MDWLDPLWISYIGLAVLFTVAELVRPARKLRYGRTSSSIVNSAPKPM